MSIKNVKFLVVDDMESMRSIVKATLHSLGVENVVLGVNGFDGIKKVEQQSFDMIISDWDMPKVNGLQFLQYVRDSKEHKHLPFLLLTASKDKQRVIKAIEAGVSDYLAKPFKPDALEAKLKKILKK
ncbi:MAG: response regulator [Pseudomonadota bacterium]